MFPPDKAWGCIFPSSRRAHVELISSAPHSPADPARPAAGCPWCCRARRAALLPAVIAAWSKSPDPAHNGNTSLLAGKTVATANGAHSKLLKAGLPALRVPPGEGKWSRGGINGVLLQVSSVLTERGWAKLTQKVRWDLHGEKQPQKRPEGPTAGGLMALTGAVCRYFQRGKSREGVV